jgi:AraC family transcriptional regulator
MSRPFRFAFNPRWNELPHCSAVINGVQGERDYVVSNYQTTLSIKSVLHGRSWYETPRGRYLVTPDSFLILNHDQQYSMEIERGSNTETLCPFFQRGFVESVGQTSAEFCERLYPMRGRVAELLQGMHKAREAGTPAAEDRFYDLADALIALRDAARRESESFPGMRASTREEMYRRLYRARDFLYSCYAEPLSVADAAGVAAMSPFHFQRMFKQAFGVSPMQFLQRRRLEVARRALLQTEDDVTSICLSVGFESLGSFSWLFKRHFGRSPSEFRSVKKT